MPARHTIYQLPELAVAPRNQIGSTGALLGTLWEQQLPVPATICIPKQTLVELAQDSHLHLKLEQLQRSSANQYHEAITDHILYLLRRTHLDRAFLHKLAIMYHEYLQADTVQIFASEGSTVREQQILGDASVIESVLTVWATSISSLLLKQPRHHQAVSDLVSASAIIISRQPQAVAAGIAHSQHPETFNKTQVPITAVWGSYTKNSAGSAAKILVDIRSNSVLSRQPHKQKSKFQQGSGELFKQPLSALELEQHPLSDAEAITLAKYVLQLKRQSLEQLTISWIRTENTLYITGVSDFVVDYSHPAQRQDPPAKLLTKLYVTGGNPSKASEQLAQPVDGVGLLRSEYFLAQFGVHPLQLLQSHHHDSLRQAMLHTIETYRKESRGKLVLFRTENFTSSELLGLKSGNAYTEQETNPAIGLRGALKNLQQPDLLHFQLTVFREALQNSNSPLGIIFPFVRSSTEARRLVQYCRELGLGGKQFAGIWLQLNTPENSLNLHEYPVSDLAGVIFNASSVLALARGIDADRQELQQAYEFPESLYTHLLEHLTDHHTAFGQFKTLVYLRHYSDSAVSIAVKAGVHGIIVRPDVATLAKASIMEAEATRFTSIKSI